MTYDEMIEILQAAKAGKVIEYQSSIDGWITWPHSCPNFANYKYRVKPEPKRCWVLFNESGTIIGCRGDRREGYIEMVEVTK